MAFFSQRSARAPVEAAPAEPRSPARPAEPTERPAVPEGRGGGPGRSPGWRSLDVLRATALVFGFYLALRLAWLAHPLFLTAFLGLLFGLAVARGADVLARFRVPRGLGATLLVFGAYALIYGIFALSAPTLSEQFGELRYRLPEATDKVERWFAEHREGVWGQVLDGATGGAPAASPTPATPAPSTPPPAAARSPRSRSAAPATPPEPAPAKGASELRNALARQLGTVGRYLFPFLSSTLEVLAGLLLITFLAIYIGADLDLYHSGLLALFPRAVRPRAAEVLGAVATALRKWLLTQLVAMVSIGALWGVALALIGVKAALSLAVIAGLLEFIPTIGPILSAVPAVAMGFLDSPQKALLVVFVYTAIQMVEGHVVIPLLMKEGMNLPPVLTLLGQAVLALVFGFLGLLVAVPLLAAILVAVRMLYVEGVVGEESVALR
jgi:predicted PurR-regulated permease PerM